jgi:hypothetical protein
MASEFLKACHLIFEKGILSHEIILSSSSPCLSNISEGMKWFLKWKESVQEDPVVKLRSPLRKVFLAWQVLLFDWFMYNLI